MGQVLFSEVHSLYAGDNLLNIDINIFPKGVYIVSIESDDFRTSKKIIKN